MDNTENKDSECCMKNEFFKAGKYKEIGAESSAEYILPDYNEDIRKILYTGAEINSSQPFLDGDEAVFSGVINYTVIYNDRDEEVRSLEFTSDYEFSVKCDPESYVDSFAKTRISSVYLRPTGPRKLTVRTGLVSEVCISERETLSASGSAFSDNKAECLSEAVSIHTRHLSAVSEREYAELIAEYAETPPDEITVLMKNAQAMLTEVRQTDGGVNIRGEADVCCVIKIADAPPIAVHRVIPIDERVSFDVELQAGCSVCGYITPVSLAVSVNTEDIGSNITASLVIEIRCVAEHNSPLNVITDAYRKECVTECTYEDLCYTSLLDSTSEVLTLSREIERERAGLLGVRDIVYLDASAKLEKCELVDDKLKLTGELRFSGVANGITEKDGICCTGVKFSIPFSENVNLGCRTTSHSIAFCDFVVGRVKTELDADRVYISCPMRVTSTVTEDNRIRHIATCEVREDLPFYNSESVVTVYYPDSDETLFGIAKKFHTSVRSIASANSLSEATVNEKGRSSSLSEIKRLLIK